MFFVKQKTAYEMRISDWSLDVCSSDLGSSMSKRPGGRSVGNGAFIATCCLVGLFRGQGSLAILPNSHEDNRNWISPSAHPGLPFRLIRRTRSGDRSGLPSMSFFVSSIQIGRAHV